MALEFYHSMWKFWHWLARFEKQKCVDEDVTEVTSLVMTMRRRAGSSSTWVMLYSGSYNYSFLNHPRDVERSRHQLCVKCDDDKTPPEISCLFYLSAVNSEIRYNRSWITKLASSINFVDNIIADPRIYN